MTFLLCYFCVALEKKISFSLFSRASCWLFLQRAILQWEGCASEDPLFTALALHRRLRTPLWIGLPCSETQFPSMDRRELDWHLPQDRGSNCALEECLAWSRSLHPPPSCAPPQACPARLEGGSGRVPCPPCGWPSAPRPSARNQLSAQLDEPSPSPSPSPAPLPQVGRRAARVPDFWGCRPN